MDGEWPPTQKNIVSIYLPAFRATFLIGFSVDIISLAADLYSTYSWGVGEGEDDKDFHAS